MSRLRLGIDLDGVVADFNAGWIDRYNRAFGAALEPSMVTSWNSPLAITHFGDMGAFWAWAQDGPCSIFRELPVYDGALTTLHALSARHEVVVVSSKYDWAIPDTLAWLAEHQVPSREIHFVWDKAQVDCDVYLDDAPHNLEALVAQRPAATVCRMVRPWNDPVERALDVAGWDHFAEVVEGLAPNGDHR